MTQKYFLPLLLCITPVHAEQAASAPNATALKMDAPAAADVSNDLFDWKWQPPIGYRGRFKNWLRTKSTKITPAQPTFKKVAQRVEKVTDRTVEIDYETISRDDRGATVSRLIFRKFHSVENQKVNGKVTPSVVTQELAYLENALVGVEIDLKHGPEGSVWNVQGLDVLQRRLSEAATRFDARERAGLLRILAWTYGEKTFSQRWNLTEGRPPQPLQVSETWRYSPTPVTNPTSDLESRIRETRRLTALSVERAVITREGIFFLRPVVRTKRHFSRNDWVEESGTLRGQIIVDRATGLPIEAHLMTRGKAKYRSATTLKDGPTSWTEFESRQTFTPLS